MKNELQLKAETRQGSLSALRRQKFIPAVLYGHGLASEAVQISYPQFEKVFAKSGLTSLLSLMVEEENHPVIIREVQYHPLKGTIQHVDFYQVRLDEAIKAKVPFQLVGESTAAKDLGGVLVHNLDELEVEALPKDLPHNLEINIAVLDTFEKVIRVKDIALPAGVTTAVDPETVAILVQPPRSDEELEALKTEVKEDVQTVEGMKTKAEQEKAAEAAPAAEGEAKPVEKKSEDKK